MILFAPYVLLVPSESDRCAYLTELLFDFRALQVILTGCAHTRAHVRRKFSPVVATRVTGTELESAACAYPLQHTVHTHLQRRREAFWALLTHEPSPDVRFAQSVGARVVLCRERVDPETASRLRSALRELAEFERLAGMNVFDFREFRNATSC
jgi:hypothetical protein